MGQQVGEAEVRGDADTVGLEGEPRQLEGELRLQGSQPSLGPAGGHAPSKLRLPRQRETSNDRGV